MRSMMGGRSGFTLLEIVMVMIIIGVLAAIALPQYQGFVERGRVAEAVTAISALKQAIMAQQLELAAWPAACADVAAITNTFGVTLNATNWTYATTNAGLITATRTAANGGVVGQTITFQCVVGGPGVWGGTHPSHPR